MGEGESLRAICRDPDIPDRATVKRWIQGERGAPAGFGAQYAQARELRAECLADEILEIADQDAADSVEVQSLKLRVDARKWAAARIDPKHWGDRVQYDVGGQPANPVVVDHTVAVENLRDVAEILSEILAPSEPSE
jgi:hypothetical protein